MFQIGWVGKPLSFNIVIGCVGKWRGSRARRASKGALSSIRLVINRGASHCLLELPYQLPRFGWTEGHVPLRVESQFVIGEVQFDG